MSIITEADLKAGVRVQDKGGNKYTLLSSSIVGGSLTTKSIWVVLRETDRAERNISESTIIDNCHII